MGNVDKKCPASMPQLLVISLQEISVGIPKLRLLPYHKVEIPPGDRLFQPFQGAIVFP